MRTIEPRAEEGSHARARPSEHAEELDLTASLAGYKAAVVDALASQDHNFERLARDRLSVNADVAKAVARCASWDDLISLHQTWADATAEACSVDARRLVIDADVIRRPSRLSARVAMNARTVEPTDVVLRRTEADRLLESDDV